jgi:ASC-1-like (ASCH) protein
MTPTFSSSVSALATSPMLTFSVVDRDCSDFSLVTKTFKDLIVPIYGSQERALNKIGQGSDRLCEMLYDGNEPKALVVYKKELNERKALELKTLIVLNPHLDSRKGYGSALISRIIQIAKMRLAQYIEVSVSSQKPKALDFFKKRQFVIHSSFPDYYQKGDTETFLYRDLNPTPPITRVTPIALPIPASVPKKTPIPLPIPDSRHVPAYTPTDHKTFGCTLKGEYVRQIQSGAKTFEGRIYSGPFRNYKVGDRVNWFAGQELRVLTEITDIKVFRTFEEMLTSVGFKKMLPYVSTFEAAVAAYNAIPGYREKAQTSGVVAFGVRPISDSAIDSVPAKSTPLAGAKRPRS